MTSGWAWSETTEWGVSSNDMYGFNVSSDPLVYLLNQDMDADPGYLFMVPIPEPHRHSDGSPRKYTS